MKLKNMAIEELELMSYTDLTYMILTENKKAMNTASIFKEICNLLDYSEDEFSNKISEYYTSLTMDKRFVLLDSNEWDIRDRHSVELVMDEEDEEIDEESEEETEEESEFETDEDEENLDEVIDVDLDDDLDDLTIVTDEELEEDN